MKTPNPKKRRAAPRFDLIPTVPLERLAARYQLGVETYGLNAWKAGLDERDIINHAIAHLLAHRDRLDGAVETGDDDCAAVGWAAMTLMHYEEARKK